MNTHLRRLLCRWLDYLGYGIVLSTALCVGILMFDLGGFGSATAQIDGGGTVRVTLWLLLIAILAPLTAMTDRWLR